MRPDELPEEKQNELSTYLHEINVHVAQVVMELQKHEFEKHLAEFIRENGLDSFSVGLTYSFGVLHLALDASRDALASIIGREDANLFEAQVLDYTHEARKARGH